MFWCGWAWIRPTESGVCTLDMYFTCAFRTNVFIIKSNRQHPQHMKILQNRRFSVLHNTVVRKIKKKRGLHRRLSIKMLWECQYKIQHWCFRTTLNNLRFKLSYSLLSHLDMCFARLHKIWDESVLPLMSKTMLSRVCLMRTYMPLRKIPWTNCSKE